MLQPQPTKGHEISPSCYVSFVVTSRNDDHGGGLLRRMQLFINGLVEQCRRYRIQAELVLVDWNPPADRPRLAQALLWPDQTGPCVVRVIEVPPEIHRRFRHSEQLPLFQMIAKNVGIRRAGGHFVLATNIDILFSDELMQFLASGRLRSERMYRVDRYDASADVPLDAPIEARLDYCRRNVLRVNTREGTHNLRSGTYHTVYPKLSCRAWILDKLQDRGLVPVDQYSRLHTNACGDFTLMSRDRWFELRGYPELEMFSFHLDAVLCHAAHHGGAREHVLPDPMRIYHIEHAAGSGFTPEGQQKLNARLAGADIAQLDHAQFVAWAVQMRRERRPIIFNDENWGLAGEDLPELVMSGTRAA